MNNKKYEELKRAIYDEGVNAIEDLLGYALEFGTDEELSKAMDDVLDQMPEDIALKFYNKYCKKTKRLHISMAYTFVGDTGIDIPVSLLEGKSEEEKLQIAYEYAQENIDRIPVADNAEYIANSDSFELEDISFEKQEELDEQEEQEELLIAAYEYEHNDGDQIWTDTVKFIKTGSTYYRIEFDGYYDRECGRSEIGYNNIIMELDNVQEKIENQSPKSRGGYTIIKNIEQEVILGFDELTEDLKRLAIENYKHTRLSDDDEEYVKECEIYTDYDWYTKASFYSYRVQRYDDGSYCVYCLF